MSIQQNSDRIQTTHIGSLPRPHDLLDLMKAKLTGQPYDRAKYDATVAKAVAESVKKQAECGIDIVSDGEFSKPGFYTYIHERLEGFESRAGQKLISFQQELAAFPEYYADYFKQLAGGALVSVSPVVCVGPVKYRGEKLLQIDIDNMKAAAKAAGVPERSRVPAGDGAVRRRHQRILQVGRRVFPRRLRRDEQGISRDHRLRHSAPGRRSVPARPVLRAGPRRRAEEATRGNLCRGDKLRARRAFRPRKCDSTPATESIMGRACSRPPCRM